MDFLFDQPHVQRLRIQVPIMVRSTGSLVLPDDSVPPSAGRGIIDRMMATPCVLEYFSDTPSADEARVCFDNRNQLYLYVKRQVEAHAELPPHFARLAALCEEEPPVLWLVSANRPETLLDECDARPLAGWPSGFHGTPRLFYMNIVTVCDVPETRDTLMLRLLGRAVTFKRVLQELHELPLDAPEVVLARPLILEFRRDVVQNPCDESWMYLEELNALHLRWSQ